MFMRKIAVRAAAVAAGLIIAGTATVSANAVTTPPPTDIVARVISGAQLYECARQSDGGVGFRQYGVRAVLEYEIGHSFVQPVAGPPQWVAPDGSAVTGTVISQRPNGPGNIPLLELRATQTGESVGLLADTARILRLNTKGGVAPTRRCTLGEIVSVPYRADYHFLRD
jgi:hypothetical protein